MALVEDLFVFICLIAVNLDALLNHEEKQTTLCLSQNFNKVTRDQDRVLYYK